MSSSMQRKHKTVSTELDLKIDSTHTEILLFK